MSNVECATLAWVHWFNTTRLPAPLGCLPSAEFAAQHYDAITPPAMQSAA